MEDNKENNQNNDEFICIYKKNSMVSHYLSELLCVQGSYIRKGLVNREIVISTLGDYNILYSMECDFDKITSLLIKETGFQDIIENMYDEPKPLLDKEKMVSLQPNMKGV